MLEEAPQLLLDWGLGSVVVGVALGAFVGLLAFAWAKRRERREIDPVDGSPGRQIVDADRGDALRAIGRGHNGGHAAAHARWNPASGQRAVHVTLTPLESP